MNKEQLNRAAYNKAGQIRNRVVSRTSGRIPRIKDYPAAVASCSVIGHNVHKEDYSRSCINYQYHQPVLGALRDLGKIGGHSPFCHNLIGNCAEPHAANQLLKELHFIPSIESFVFGDTIRPRTMQVLPYCNNCKQTFPSLK